MLVMRETQRLRERDRERQRDRETKIETQRERERKKGLTNIFLKSDFSIPVLVHVIHRFFNDKIPHVRCFLYIKQDIIR